MGPATALCLLLLLLGGSETKRAAGKAGSVLGHRVREGGSKNKKLWCLFRQMKLCSVIKSSKGLSEVKRFNLSISYMGTGKFSLMWNLCNLQKQDRRVSRT